MPRFFLDETRLPRAPELLATFGFPVLGVGYGVPELPRGQRTPDVAIATWCGLNQAIWVTVDRGLLKDRVIVDAIIAHDTSLLLLPGRGMRVRDYLRLLVNRLDEWEQIARSRATASCSRQAEWRSRPHHARAARRTSPAPLAGATLQQRAPWTPTTAHRPARSALGCFRPLGGPPPPSDPF